MTDDQLTVLVDRACRGVASPAEAEQLRAAIAQLQQQAQRPASIFHGVQGTCPTCHTTSLILGVGGYVTCARLECPDPTAASELLEQSAAVPAATQQQACDHRDPNRLGHRRDLATVCACGHEIFPPPFEPRPSRAQP